MKMNLQDFIIGKIAKIFVIICISLPALGLIWVTHQHTSEQKPKFFNLENKSLFATDHTLHERLQSSSLPFPHRETCCRMAFYDVGSTSTKFTVVDLNFLTQSHSVLETEDIALPFTITEENYQERINVLKKLQDKSDTSYAQTQKPVKHVAIATAGFRNAGPLGEKLAKDINNQTHINFKIIEQEDEGILSYMAIEQNVPNFNPQSSLVWDIGGGSFQIVAKNEHNEYEYWGTKIAAISLHNYLVENFLKNKKLSTERKTLEPLNQKGIEECLDMAETLLHESWSHQYHGLSNREFAQIHKHIEKPNSVIYGVGAVHYYVILFLVNKLLDKNQTTYTKADLVQILHKLQGKTDAEISEMTGIKNMDYVTHYVSSVILVLATMNAMGADYVQVFNFNNTDGLIAREIISYRH